MWYVTYLMFSSNCDGLFCFICRSKQQRLYQAMHSKLTIRFDFLEWRRFVMTKDGLIA